MTIEARLEATGQARGYPRPPRTIRLALLAAFVTAILAGPATLSLFLAGQAAVGTLPFSFAAGRDAAERLAELLLYSVLFGLVGSVPAATINTGLLAFLARRRRDASGLAIASGSILGLLVGVTIATLFFLSDDEFGPGFDEPLLSFALNLGLPFLVAGGFMGALHWSIAIRPRRRWRLFQERERAALLAME